MESLKYYYATKVDFRSYLAGKFMAALLSRPGDVDDALFLLAITACDAAEKLILELDSRRNDDEAKELLKQLEMETN